VVLLTEAFATLAESMVALNKALDVIRAANATPIDALPGEITATSDEDDPLNKWLKN
jgi:hypothetical protein